jgi:hypothetical protein
VRIAERWNRLTPVLVLAIGTSFLFCDRCAICTQLWAAFALDDGMLYFYE